MAMLQVFIYNGLAIGTQNGRIIPDKNSKKALGAIQGLFL